VAQPPDLYSYARWFPAFLTRCYEHACQRTAGTRCVPFPDALLATIRALSVTRNTWTRSPDVAANGGRVVISRHVIGCRLTPEARVQGAVYEGGQLTHTRASIQRASIDSRLQRFACYRRRAGRPSSIYFEFFRPTCEVGVHGSTRAPSYVLVTLTSHTPSGSLCPMPPSGVPLTEAWHE
jgi:hypothetical protein